MCDFRRPVSIVNNPMVKIIAIKSRDSSNLRL